MLFKILPFYLAVLVTGDHDAGYVAACINAGIIK